MARRVGLPEPDEPEDDEYLPVQSAVTPMPELNVQVEIAPRSTVPSTWEITKAGAVIGIGALARSSRA